MLKITLLGSLLIAAVVTAGCERRPTDPTTPKADVAQSGTVLPPAPVSDPSLPPATAALGAAPGEQSASAGGELKTGPMTRSEESVSMPLGGQANDHSAPKSSDQPASAASAVR